MDDDPNPCLPQTYPTLSDQGRFCVTSWNINSIRARFGLFQEYLEHYKPDVVLLQEIKAQNNDFPFLELQSMGYFSAVKGQKSYNGVAILSKESMVVVNDTVPNAPDLVDQARFIEVKSKQGTHFISVYVPNGQASASNSDSTEKLDYKIKWLSSLNEYISSLLASDIPFVLGGDFNVIEKDQDVYNPLAFSDSVFTKPVIREKFRTLRFMGLTNTLRFKADLSPLYSYWDYKGLAFSKNNGILLDHIFASPSLADRLDQATVHSDYRGKEKASDHAPIWCSFV